VLLVHLHEALDLATLRNIKILITARIARPQSCSEIVSGLLSCLLALSACANAESIRPDILPFVFRSDNLRILINLRESRRVACLSLSRLMRATSDPDSFKKLLEIGLFCYCKLPEPEVFSQDEELNCQYNLIYNLYEEYRNRVDEKMALRVSLEDWAGRRSEGREWFVRNLKKDYLAMVSELLITRPMGTGSRKIFEVKK
jgi:hypothetical protein